MSANRHCHYCGSQYPQVESFPRTCPACGQMVWSNPLPVAVVAVRAEGGVIIAQNSQIILFSATRSMYRLSDFTFQTSEETLDLRILREPEELAFAGHTIFAQKFLAG